MKEVIKAVFTKQVIKSTIIKLGIAFLIFGYEPVEVAKTDIVITGEIRKPLCI